MDETQIRRKIAMYEKQLSDLNQYFREEPDLTNRMKMINERKELEQAIKLLNFKLKSYVR